MNRVVQTVICFLSLLSTASANAFAGFDFSFFRLRSITQDSSGPSIISDVETIDSPQNPIHILQDTGIGPNYSRTMFDVSWLNYTGVFNAAFDQHIEQRRFNTSMSRRLEFFADVDLLLTADIMINYTSSASDFALIQGTFSLGNFSQPGAYPSVLFRGGAAAVLPASGTFTYHVQYLLPAGSQFTTSFTMSGDSIAATGALHAPINITGYSNLSIVPVPEPHTALLVSIAPVLAFCRRRKSTNS